MLPPINRLIALRDDAGDEYRSRVEDVEDDYLVVARPLDLRTAHGFAPGSTLVVTWPDENGINAVPAELVESRTEGAVGLWVVQVSGESWREQRRAFVRVPVVGSVTVRIGAVPEEPTRTARRPQAAAAAELPETTGRLIDLSEAALRCALPSADLEAVGPGADVIAQFQAAGSDFEIPGTILKLTPSERQPGWTETVLTFSVSEDKASAIRRIVFAEQINIRNRVRGD